MTRRPDLSRMPEDLAEDEFWRLFGRLEHAELDFKRGVGGSVLDAIPAMAMTGGGLIVHGVDANLNIVGCPLSQRTRDRITRFANECGVEVRVRALRVGGRELTATEVPEVRERIVTTPDGRLLRRVGGDCQPLRGDALARFVRERELQSGEEAAVVASAAAFDLPRVNEALAADGRPPADASGIARALADLGVAAPAGPDGAPQALLAAAVLFAVNPREFVRGAAVQLVRREGVGPGPGPAADREECSGPLADVVECCLGFIDRHTRRHEVVRDARRETLPEYPAAAVREAVLNALAHRDYWLAGATTDITIWDDRIEFRSPGPLPGPITVDNMRREHHSRNGRLMRVLKTLGFVEEYGEGVDRMFREMEARLMTPPVFAATSDSVTVTLHNRFLVSVDDQAWLSLLGAYPMTADERLALVEARREGSVTRRRLRRLMPDSGIDRLIAGMLAKGLLVRVGRRGGARYMLSDEVVLRAGSEGLEARQRRRQLLLDEIGRRGSLSTAEGAELIGEHMAATRRLLNELAAAGQARAAGATRARRYYPA